MKSIMFDNGDIVINSKRLQIVSDTEQKIQKTKAALLTVLGELYYNTNIGLDYAQVLSISEKYVSDDKKKIAITEALMKDSNVEKVTDITIETNEKSRKQYITVKLKYKDDSTITTIGGVGIG